MPFPQFQPETIAVALYNQLLTAVGTDTGQYPFASTDRRGQLPQNVPAADQPYMGLVELGFTQLESQAQGLEKWLFHFRVLVYIRADANPNAVPATEINNALQAIVQAMRANPIGTPQRLGTYTVDNAWIEGEVLVDTGILDQQCALLVPILVVTGI